MCERTSPQANRRHEAGLPRWLIWLCMGPLGMTLHGCGGNSGSGGSADNQGAQGAHVLYEQRPGAGIQASPSVDTDYPTGTLVNYSFVGVDPMATVIVKMDGAPVAASGVIRMDATHRLTAAISNAPGVHAPAFSGQTPDGQTVRLSDYRGRYVFVDFSEQTCPGSVNQASYLQTHASAWQAKGMDIVTVLVHGGTSLTAPATPTEVGYWKTTYGLSFLVLTDTDNSTAIYNWDEQHQTTDFPSSYIIDPQGVVVYKFRGFDGPTIDAAIAALFP